MRSTCSVDPDALLAWDTRKPQASLLNIEVPAQASWEHRKERWVAQPTGPGGGRGSADNLWKHTMKMQFGDVTQPLNAQAKFSRVSAMLLFAWQLHPKVPWAEWGW